MEAKLCEWKPIRAGVPHCALLSSLLYNICVADVPRRPGIKISQLDDDTAAFTANNNINYAVNNLRIYIYIILDFGYTSGKWKLTQI
jgi:hypothetical protein